MGQVDNGNRWYDIRAREEEHVEERIDVSTMAWRVSSLIEAGSLTSDMAHIQDHIGRTRYYACGQRAGGSVDSALEHFDTDQIDIDSCDAITTPNVSPTGSVSLLAKRLLS